MKAMIQATDYSTLAILWTTAWFILAICLALGKMIVLRLSKITKKLISKRSYNNTRKQVKRKKDA